MPGQFEWITLLQIPLVLCLVWILSLPLSTYIARVALEQPTFLDKIISPIALWFYRLISINPEAKHRWQTYALSAVTLNLMGALFLIILQMTQGYFSSMSGVGFVQALNTAISFSTNTNWQSYTPETSIANFVQTCGLTVQMFISAGTGMAVALAVTRGFTQSVSTTQVVDGSKIAPIRTLGNFWVDCTRMILWVLLPLSFLLTIVFIGLGISQSIVEAVASQEAIKLLGTNGGGFFSANSASPLECPSAMCNLIQIIAMLLIVFSFPSAFGKMIGEPLQGRSLLIAMLVLFSVALGLALLAQYHTIFSLGPTLEGMETRFGWIGTLLFNVTSTTTGTGATSAALSSLPPLTSLELLSNILAGAVIFGGVGSGLYNIILYTILSVFIAGLMVGRTPEYLGKKIESFEIKMVVVAIMFPALCVLVLTTLGAIFAPDGVLNPPPHGLTEILYTFSSTTFNNGSSFGGFKSDMSFYQFTTIFAMSAGRFVVILAVLALAGSFAQKPKITPTTATFPTTGALFIGLLISVITITSILIFFPISSLGPIAEQVSSWNLPPSL